MALQQIIDVTDAFNAASAVVIDMGGFDYAIAQVKTPSSAISFESTNISGNPSNAVNAADFTAIQGTILGSGTAATSINANGMVRFSYAGQYLKLKGTAATVANLTIRLFKVS